MGFTQKELQKKKKKTNKQTNNNNNKPNRKEFEACTVVTYNHPRLIEQTATSEQRSIRPNKSQ